MSRFILTSEATRDLDDILIYNRSLPLNPGNRVGRSLQHLLKEIGSSPLHGSVHREFSHIYGDEIRSRIVAGYVIYYAAVGTPRLILGILHGKRDIDLLMRDRLT